MNPIKENIKNEKSISDLTTDFWSKMMISQTEPLGNFMGPNNFSNYGFQMYNRFQYPSPLSYQYQNIQSPPQNYQNYYPQQKNNFMPNKKVDNRQTEFSSNQLFMKKYEAKENKEFDSINKIIDESYFNNSAFFIIKSYNEENVLKAVQYNIWSSTKIHNTELDRYFKTNKVILFFSINGSGQFYGAAEMTSSVSFDSFFEGWSQKDKWMSVFTIKWLFLKDIPNKEFKDIKNPLNLNKPVHNSRDCQEVPFEEGIKVLRIFQKNQNQSSILAKLI